MHIVHVTPELAPIAKVGGLGDVVYGLSKELKRQGHTLSIFLPKYDCLDTSPLSNLTIHASFSVGAVSNTLFSATFEGLNLFLIEPHDSKQFFQRGSIYGGSDEIDRFLYFCQAAAKALALAAPTCDLVHLHDWPTAALTALIKIPSVLTIHNLFYQGKCEACSLTTAGFTLPMKTQEANLLQMGIEKATQVTTVSPQYAKEILTPEGSCGLLDTLVSCRHKLHGILNGIDANFWNPMADPYLPFQYGSTPGEGKRRNKQALCNRLGLEDNPSLPLVSVITRLVPQKSPYLIRHALLRTLEKRGQFILLGSVPDKETEEEFRLLKEALAANPHVKILMKSEEGLAHQIYAASDFLLIPSLFEPCGLTQLIALKYGAVPIARRTGGLADTVFDIDTASSIAQDLRNGFTFDHPDIQGVDWALLRALECYKTNPAKYQMLMSQGMRADFSWTQSASTYLSVYKTAINEKRTPAE
jgi:starch synthase